MIAYVATNKETGRVEEVFIAEQGEMKDVEWERFRTRLEQCGYTLSKRVAQPVKVELAEFVAQVERGDY